MVLTYDTFAEADAQRTDKDKESVSCVYGEDGKPIYFLVPECDRKMEIAREASFMILRGRPISGYEKWLLDAAEDQRAGARPPGFEAISANAD